MKRGCCWSPERGLIFGGAAIAFGDDVPQPAVQLRGDFGADPRPQRLIIGDGALAQIAEHGLSRRGERQDFGAAVLRAGIAGQQPLGLQRRDGAADLGFLDMADGADVARGHGAELAQIGQHPPLRAGHAIGGFVAGMEGARGRLGRLIEQVGQKGFKVEISGCGHAGGSFVAGGPCHRRRRLSPRWRHSVGLTRSGWAAAKAGRASARAAMAQRRGKGARSTPQRRAL